jgi:hypothetical protein
VKVQTEEFESGDMSGANSDKQRLFETREDLREAKQESLRLSGEIDEDDDAEDDDADDDDDDTHIKEEERATLRTQNAELLRKLHRKTGAATAKLSTWKPGSLHAMSSDAPSFTEPNDVAPVRKFALEWLGYHSFVLRLSKEEHKMLTTKEIDNHERRHQEFRDTYTAPSLHQLHHDIYMALKRLLGKSIMVSNLFNQVTTETSSCASVFWDLLRKTFLPSSPQAVAGLTAAAAGNMHGPDHSSADPEKAVKHWNAAVASLLQVGDVVMTPERFGAVMMYASLHGSTKDTYYNAFIRLNDSLTRGTSTFDVATVRAAAVLAFNAENRRLKKTPPDSFAAAVGPRRSSTVSGSHTAGPGCCKCPVHCKLPDGTFRVVRARDTDAAANVGTAATAPTSSESRHALQIYHAAVDDFDTPDTSPPQQCS